jgi:hypothetical protein
MYYIYIYIVSIKAVFLCSVLLTVKIRYLKMVPVHFSEVHMHGFIKIKIKTYLFYVCFTHLLQRLNNIAINLAYRYR